MFLICDVTNARVADATHQVVRSTDGVEVVIALPPGERFESAFVQVEGKLIKANPFVIDAMRLQPVTGDFDINNYNKALELMHGQYQQLFA